MPSSKPVLKSDKIEKMREVTVPQTPLPVSLMKSKQRVADHGEVFTPSWMVEAMLDLVKDETERIDSRFLEPACGSGNFLAPILRRKLAAVELKYGTADFQRGYHALLGLMCMYGIELLPDNIADCRANLLEIFAEYLRLAPSDDLYRAASYVLSQNLVHGDARTMRTRTEDCKSCKPSGSHGDAPSMREHTCQPIIFPEWGPLGKGKFQRRDFLFDSLTKSSAYKAEAPLFAHLGKHEIFTPIKPAYTPMTVTELAGFAQEAAV
ncbi:MAG TPA: SAM-dependent DNA methyltransferase [Nitrospira sp.]